MSQRMVVVELMENNALWRMALMAHHEITDYFMNGETSRREAEAAGERLYAAMIELRERHQQLRMPLD